MHPQPRLDSLWSSVLYETEMWNGNLARHQHDQCMVWLVAGQHQAAQIAKFMGPTWGQPGSFRPQMGSTLAPSTLLSGYFQIKVLTVSFWSSCIMFSPYVMTTNEWNTSFFIFCNNQWLFTNFIALVMSFEMAEKLSRNIAAFPVVNSQDIQCKFPCIWKYLLIANDMDTILVYQKIY